MPRSRSGFLALALVGLAVAPAAAQEPLHIQGLGALSFPNSGAPPAQYDFLRGVLLLHSFEYDDAAAAFRRAQEIDPDFALAHWGEAMTYTHPVWNEKDQAAARAALARYAPTPEARAARAPTERERGWLEAVDLLYGDGPKARLDTLYAGAMAALSERYPDDLEAKAFHALALLGLSQGDRDVPRYMEAGAIALDVFGRNPLHPGAAHYVIHAFDDPTHAVLAMEAARAYGPIAPDAGHAQHMTSHIFLARGMWDDVVEANIRADGVVDRARAAAGLPPTWCGHYNQWLSYGYQQEGRVSEAREIVVQCRAQVDDARLPMAAQGAADASAGMQRAWYLADTEEWGGVVEALRSRGPWPSPTWFWGTGFAAARAGDVPAAKAELERLRGAVEVMAPTDWIAPYAPVWIGTLQAEIARAEGDLDRALGIARGAAEFEAALPVDFGPPIALKPAREVEGEVLMEMGQYAEAAAAFDLQLARTPNRIRAMLGRARAHLRLGDAAGIETYERLEELLDEAEAGFEPALLTRAALSGAAAGRAGSGGG